MAQITIYLDDELIQQVKQSAAEAKGIAKPVDCRSHPPALPQRLAAGSA